RDVEGAKVKETGWLTFFCPAHGATLHTREGAPQEPCTSRLDWLRRYKAERTSRGFGNPLTNESNRQKVKEYGECLKCKKGDNV
ncbi:MAG: hypothetical protein NUW09_05100, partial [Deltaproteobacteria bacterium]|nr:hypothetical protein [Deltaproteobacteria bacterium]